MACSPRCATGVPWSCGTVRVTRWIGSLKKSSLGPCPKTWVGNPTVGFGPWFAVEMFLLNSLFQLRPAAGGWLVFERWPEPKDIETGLLAVSINRWFVMFERHNPNILERQWLDFAQQLLTSMRTISLAILNITDHQCPFFGHHSPLQPSLSITNSSHWPLIWTIIGYHYPLSLAIMLAEPLPWWWWWWFILTFNTHYYPLWIISHYHPTRSTTEAHLAMGAWTSRPSQGGVESSVAWSPQALITSWVFGCWLEATDGYNGTLGCGNQREPKRTKDNQYGYHG